MIRSEYNSNDGWNKAVTLAAWTTVIAALLLVLPSGTLNAVINYLAAR